MRDSFRYILTALLYISSVSGVVRLYAASDGQQPEVAGATLFREKGCTYCHGDSASGTPKGPSLTDLRKKLKTPQIVNQISNGGQKMPAFGDSLSNAEMLQLAAFLRAKHRPPVPPATQTPPPASPLSNPAQ